MAAPNVPSEFKALISDPTSTLCGNFVNTLLRLPILLYNLVAYLFDDTGNPSKAFINASLRTGSLLFSACLQTEDGTIMLCDGRQVSQTTYADLYAKIGSTYGSASPGNFLLPDFRGVMVAGLGSGTDVNGQTQTFALGTKTGEVSHKLTSSELAAHTHDFTVTAHNSDASGSGVLTGGVNNSSGGDGSFSGTTVATGGDGYHNNVPLTLGCYVYIVA
jgi:microcystin-dependent protein